MKRRSQRLITISATNAKKIRIKDDDEDLSLEVNDVNSGDKDGTNVSDGELKGIEEKKEGEKRLSRDDKGKGVVDVSDVSDDSEWGSNSADSSSDDYKEYIKSSMKKKNGSVEMKGVNLAEGENSIDLREEIQGQESNVAVNIPEVRPGGREYAFDIVRLPFRPRPSKRRGRKGENRPALLWEIMEDENDKWIDEHSSESIDWDCLEEKVTETAEPSQDLTISLLRYQKEWLAWALNQEESVSRGGILADEMGMGKTIQAIALVLAKRALSQKIGGSNVCPPSLGLSGGLPEIKCTLVICPVVAVIQWVEEVAKYTAEGSTRVLVYHGPNRRKSLAQFCDYDFVMTTYSIVEAEYRKNAMPAKEKCVWCGKLYLPKKMGVHLRYFCGPDAIRTDKQSKQARKKGKPGKKSSKSGPKSTLAEVSSEDSEVSEGEGTSKALKRKMKQAKKGKELGGSDKKFEAGEAGGSEEHGSCLRNSLLHSVKWNRIILDEAHYIKDRRSNTARAVLALESSYKWALSGTPLQNRVGELYSLVRFLQITPYSYYFCRDCDCKSLDYSTTTQCPNCPHKSVRHFCWWNKFVATPIQTSSSSNEGRRAMILLKHKLLKSIVLRRTKKGRASDLALPPRIVRMRRDTLDVKEEDYYESLYNDSQLQFNTYIEAGTLMNNYAHIFDLLTRLRQAVDHPYLVIYSNSAVSRNQNNICHGEHECGLCHDPAEDPVVTSCEHAFCKACLTDYAAALGEAVCPSCSKPLTADFTAKVNPGDQNTRTTIKGYRCSSIMNRISLTEFQTSSKIDALKEEIRFMVERDGSAKGIVFSQFTSFLDLIRYSLEKSGIQCVQLVGSMTMAARDVAIKRFTDDPDCKIFLMGLKAGGVALNLTVASHVFLMDPWWNPAVERQAQDRIHRIGQYKPIRITRFIIENTVEERILKLQEKKELVFEGTVGGSAEALAKLTEADLKFLFAN
ncbi:Dna repair protein rad16 [Thalictrum thalictroides]|uniref:Dna repair protein rad16 n=1 Tax=Thalictrum thalictroides TaxID=46969 RepID=A0A7J6WJA0_THATH|nr:Dna repair protein rad16 [Thalictrum thalictroides]